MSSSFRCRTRATRTADLTCKVGLGTVVTACQWVNNSEAALQSIFHVSLFYKICRNVTRVTAFLQMEPLRCLKGSGNKHPVSQCHIAEEPTRDPHRYESVKTRKVIAIYAPKCCQTLNKNSGTISVAVWSVASRLLESLARISLGHECLPLVFLSVVSVDASATGRSLIQGRPTDCVSHSA
jgi:hypothetical protein